MLSLFSKALVLGFIFFGIGAPVNRLPEFLVFAVAFFLVTFGSLRLERRRMLSVVGIIIAAWGLARMIEPPAIDEGFNVFIFKNDPGALSKGLPSDVFDAMAGELDGVLAGYRCNESQPGCWRNKTSRPDRVHAFSADGAPDAAQGYSRQVRDIGFSHRDQLFSAAINRHSRYNFYGSEKNPDRQTLPVFVSHRFPAAYEGSRLCWQGTLLRPDADVTFERFAATGAEQCLVLEGLAERPDTIAYGINPAEAFSMRLDRSWTIAVREMGGRFMRLAAVVIAVMLLVNLQERRRLLVPALALGGTLLWAAGWDFGIKASALLDGLTIYRGGTDGLTHDGMARDILFHAMAGNWIEMLRGGESVFYYQPAFRYALALGKFLFGETHYFYLLVAAVVPVVVYRLLSLLFPPRWAMSLFLVFLFTPLFERMGFSQFNFIYQVHRGHAEPLGYGALLAAMCLFLPNVQSGAKSLAAASPRLSFVGGLLLALAVATRPNLVPGAAILAAGAGLLFLQQRDFRPILPMVLGGMSVFLVLLHNIVFGGRFVLLSDVSTNPFNLRMTPLAYWDAFKAMFSFDFGSDAWMRMVAHLGEWNGLTDFYRLPLVAVALFVLLQKQREMAVRIVAAAAVAQQGMLLFYNAGGRYSYMAWMLCFLVSAVFLREDLLPMIRRWRERRALASAFAGHAGG